MTAVLASTSRIMRGIDEARPESLRASGPMEDCPITLTRCPTRFAARHVGVQLDPGETAVQE